VTSQLSNTVAAKLSAVEASLKENVIKVVKSKVCVCVCVFKPFSCVSFTDILARLLPFNIMLMLLPGLQSMTDAIARAATEALQGTIQASYKEAFQTIVLPVFDRGCQSMFQQINEGFKQGTQECMFLHRYLVTTCLLFVGSLFRERPNAIAVILKDQWAFGGLMFPHRHKSWTLVYFIHGRRHSDRVARAHFA